VPNIIARMIAYFFVGIFYAVGPLLLIIAIGLSIPTARFVLASTPTDGKIIYMQRVYFRQFSKSFYKPVVRFTANDGQIHSFVADSRSGLTALKLGDTVRVRYIQDHPDTARIDTVAQLWMPQLILAVLGAAFTTVPIRIQMRRRALRQMQ
jgi:Protein of unknown function (DUF3592)